MKDLGNPGPETPGDLGSKTPGRTFVRSTARPVSWRIDWVRVEVLVLRQAHERLTGDGMTEGEAGERVRRGAEANELEGTAYVLTIRVFCEAKIRFSSTHGCSQDSHRF